MPQPQPRDLLTAQAGALREALAALSDTADPGALAGVRAAYPEADPGLISALATQLRLQRRAEDRLGSWAREMVLEEEALQQATRRDVARYRAARIAERLDHSQAANRTVADVGCGLGVDARALAETGLRVLAIERDPWRAEAAEINLALFADRVRVLCGDALSLDSAALDSCEAAYVDPARRAQAGPRRIDGGRSRAVSDPGAWSPPWPWVVALSERMPVVAKVSPGFDARLAPAAADIEWLDHDGDTVEASVWLGSWGHGMRRAVALGGEVSESIEAPRTEAAPPGPSTSQVGPLLVEPTPAVIRAQLVARLAEMLDAPRLDGGDWLTASQPCGTLLARAWRVIDEVPHGARELRGWLRGWGSVTWKTADAHVSAQDWDRRVGHRAGDGAPVTIVITGQGRAFAVERAQA